MADFATVLFERLDGSTWVRTGLEDLGTLLAGTPGSTIDLRVRNVGVDRTGVLLYTGSESTTLGTADLVELAAWGDAGYGLQVQQKNGPLPADWGSWTSFTSTVTTMTLSRYGVDPNQTTDGDLPKSLACQFRIRLYVPPGEEGRSRKFKPRLGVRYASAA